MTALTSARNLPIPAEAPINERLLVLRPGAATAIVFRVMSLLAVAPGTAVAAQPGCSKTN